MYVLDTTVLSALMRGEPGPAARLLSVTPEQVRVPQPVLAEICFGLSRLRRSRRRTMLETRFERLLEAIPRVEWDDEVSRRFGAAKAALEHRGRRIDDFDIAIAAHALALDAVLVTCNVRHFDRVPGLRVEDWTSVP